MNWRDIFFPKPWPGVDEANYGQLRRRCKQLLKELPQHPQGAEPAQYIKSLLGAHPLVDDMRRAIRKAEAALAEDA